MRVYLDVCCYCRPFDNKTHERISLEVDAVLAILDLCKNGKHTLIGSVVIDEEISYILEYERKTAVSNYIELIQEYIPIDSDIISQANVFEQLGMHLFDALHCACARIAHATFLTTDDHIINIISKNPQSGFYVSNPVNWLMEVNHEDY